MKKLCCMLALAAISFSSVYAHGSVQATGKTTMATDTVKKKVKVKNGKTKIKVKKDTTKTKKPDM